MNVAQSISSREKGFGYPTGYDIALLRLKCYKEDVYQGVSANDQAPDYNPNPPVFACKFCCAPGNEHILALANEDGKIALQDINAKNQFEGPLPGTQAHNNAIFDIAWMPKELKLVTASGDRSAILWDASHSSIEPVQTFHGNIHSIKAAVFRPQDKSVFATGARDGTIMIWDIRANHSGQPKPDNVIINAHELKTRETRMSHSVTALAFQDDETLISCSAGDGLIKAWDLRKMYTIHKKENISKHSMNYGGKSNTYNGFTSMMIDPSGSTLYASCIDRKIYAYNILTYSTKPVAEYYGHGSDDKVLTFFVKACLSPDGEYIASGSNDEVAYVWSTRKPGLPVLKLSGHRDEVTCIAWSYEKETKIVTCSDDCIHRIWRVRPKMDYEDEEMNLFGYAEKYEKSSNLTPSKLSVYSTPRSSCISSTEKYSCVLTPVPENVGSSPSRALSNDSRASRKLFFSPSTRFEMSSPSRSCCSSSNYESDDMFAFSPTSGLPNFVVDGTAPHLLANSPQKKTKENVNWLVQLRKRKRAEKGDKNESPNTKKSKTPTRKAKSQRGLRFKKDEKTTPKASTLSVPAITDYYNNLSQRNGDVKVPNQS